MVLIFVSISVIYFIISRPSKMPNASLPIFNGELQADTKKSVGGYCTFEKCLTIYLAPWCPSCRSAHSMILELVEDLEKSNITTNLVLGMDSPEKLSEYAQTFPFPVLLDTDRTYFEQLDGKGVPLFIVSNSNGKIIEKISGAHQSASIMRRGLSL